MNEKVKFGIFDNEAEANIESRSLPHWFRAGVAVFITFRTADSLPRKVIARWEDELRDWLQRCGWTLGPDQPLPAAGEVPEYLPIEYQRLRQRLWHWHLDTCHGDCLLRRRELAEFVMKTLLHFNGERYDLASAIIMPNHVHLIAQFVPPTTCRKQCTNWLHYSANAVNRRMNRSGAFWQSEPFDHLIRSESQFRYLQGYIADNGKKANLPASDYLHWSCEG